jgi:hypothetical protein
MRGYKEVVTVIKVDRQLGTVKLSIPGPDGTDWTKIISDLWLGPIGVGVGDKLLVEIREGEVPSEIDFGEFEILEGTDRGG